jgi:SAM-dependent methyltransferase
LPEIAAYYGRDYRISLATEEHDQLYAYDRGKPVYRTDHQARIVLEKLSLSPGVRLLDYGAAKAQTLARLLELRPDVQGSVFDVSDMYRPYWSSWLEPEAQATYQVPLAWHGQFDFVTAHFVLEHVERPVEVLKLLKSLLRPGGRLFVSVPNVYENVGDFVVVDHIHHYSRASLANALHRAGLTAVEIDGTCFSGALIAVAHPSGRGEGEALAPDAAAFSAARRIADFWCGVDSRLASFATANLGPSAIYGAGFYGAYIRAAIAGEVDVKCFVDRNPHLQGTEVMGLPVVHPRNLRSDIKTVYAGLNPARARAILADVPEWRGRALRICYLDA